MMTSYGAGHGEMMSRMPGCRAGYWGMGPAIMDQPRAQQGSTTGHSTRHQLPRTLPQPVPAAGHPASTPGTLQNITPPAYHRGPSLWVHMLSIFPPAPADVPCKPTQLDKLLEEEGIFTYLFQPSAHTLSRTVTSAQLWFYSGPSAAPNHSAPDVLALSPQGRVPVTAMVVQTPEHWTVFHLAPALLPQLSQPLFVLLVRCPGCPCLAEEDKMPFLVATTRAKGSERARRSAVPWSPAALSLLQRPSTDLAAHTNCRRASLNISFEELGWDKWIVHPSSFVFHYCHGSCAEGHGLSHRLGVQLCCAALPGTMRSLRVRTTSDGGYSFKYETVPNILAQDCTCV